MYRKITFRGGREGKLKIIIIELKLLQLTSSNSESEVQLRFIMHAHPAGTDFPTAIHFALFEICQYQNYPEVRWKNSNVAQLPLL